MQITQHLTNYWGFKFTISFGGVGATRVIHHLRPLWQSKQDVYYQHIVNSKLGSIPSFSIIIIFYFLGETCPHLYHCWEGLVFPRRNIFSVTFRNKTLMKVDFAYASYVTFPADSALSLLRTPTLPSGALTVSRVLDPKAGWRIFSYLHCVVSISL